MCRLISFLFVLLCGNVYAELPAVSTSGDSAFDKISALIGEWQGTLPDGKPIQITYEEINGGAIVERYHSTDPMWWNMSSVYHKDTDKIMLSHYCSWGNHPRMSAKPPQGNINSLAFEFIDITRTQPEKGYMHNVTFRFKDNDHFAHDWVWREGGKDIPLTLTMTRVKPD